MIDMLNMFFSLIYIYFLKNILFLIRVFFHRNIDSVFVIFCIFFCLFIYLFFIQKINKNFKVKNINLYFYNRVDVMKSTVIVIIFIFYYLIYLRVMNLFCIKMYNINIFEIKKQFLSYCDNNNLIILLLLLSILLLYIVLYFFNFLAFFFAKKHYLKLHYFFFRRYNCYNLLLDSIVNLELKIYKKLNRNYIYFLFIEHNVFRIIIFFLCIKAFIFDSGNLNSLFLMMPYYSMYYFLLNIKNFILYKFQFDFEVLIMESYYKNMFFLIELNEKKKYEYKKFILLNSSEYLFKDSIYLDNFEYLQSNFLIVDIYKYTINKKPNDFFSRIYKIKPKYVKNL